MSNKLGVNPNWFFAGEGPKYIQADQSLPPADLPPDEQALLNKYRGMTSNGKRTMQTVGSALTEQEIDEETK